MEFVGCFKVGMKFRLCLAVLKSKLIWCGQENCLKTHPALAVLLNDAEEASNQRYDMLLPKSIGISHNLTPNAIRDQTLHDLKLVFGLWFS